MVAAKSAKSRSQITKDFDKRKTKLGKGKQATNNATNTSFKARSIALPQQSIGRERENTLVTRRKLNLEDLLGQLRHPTANVRRDALNGLLELLQDERSLNILIPSRIVGNVVRLLSDDDVGVRNALLQFWTAYTTKLTAKRLIPYTSIVVLHITSSMSHIFPDIRIDAVKFLNISLTAFGQCMVIGWENFANSISDVGQAQKVDQSYGARLLKCYFTQLGIPLTPTIDAMGVRKDSDALSNARASILSTDLSNHALLVILSSLDRFLEFALQEISSTRSLKVTSSPDKITNGSDKADIGVNVYPSCLIVSTLSDEAEQNSFLQTLSPSGSTFEKKTRTSTCGNSEALFAETYDLFEDFNARDSFYSVAHSFHNFEVIGSPGKGLLDTHISLSSLEPSTGFEARQKIFCSLVPLLQTCFLDAVPFILEQRLTSSTMEKDSSKSTSFRIVKLVVSISLQLWRGLRRADHTSHSNLSKLLNRIAAHFPFGSTETSESQEAWLDTNLSFCELHGLFSSLASGKDAQCKSHVDLIYGYIQHLFESEKTVLYGSRFVAILPTVWLLLGRVDDGRSTELISGLIDHWHSIPLGDHFTRRLSTRFLGHLLILPTFSSYNGRYDVLQDENCRSKLIKWLSVSLPKRLWELNTREPIESDEILELWRQVSVRYGDSANNKLTQSDIKALTKPFCAFFCTEHTKYGKIDGPFIRLPVDVQKRALGVMHSLPFDQQLFSAVQSVMKA
ncbi:uncharacterized protein FA14DRAFT_159553 [Meira miltonrushii]|uniref:Pre-rRNA-processing protein n=1 Tax=Meira miltonrushii TaxID=1280837 RepID=A0A316VN66_9BASI|nr:uncharacterized protein FA14DRAFT_159553 [Meira miltonrushii]PWN37541.1 hypothetical protein FA14DRAFT_159553 [Meira miltonrushii]